jgi:hypothetical protein
VFLRSSILRFWYLGYGLLWGVQFGLYSTNSSFGIAGFNRVPNDAFNLASLITVIVVCFLVALLYWRGRSLPAYLPVRIPIIIYLLSILILAFPTSFIPNTAVLIIVGVVSGLCYTLMLLNWLKLFAQFEPKQSVHKIALSSLLGTFICFLLAFTPFVLTILLIVVLLAISGYAQYCRIRICEPFAGNGGQQRGQKILPALSGQTVCVCVMGFAFAIISQVAFAGPAGFAGANVLIDLGMFVSALLFLIISIVRLNHSNPATIYKFIFPILGAALLFLPFLEERYWAYLGMFVTIASHLVAIAFVFLVADVIHAKQAESHIVAGVCNGLAQIAILAGILLGMFVVGSNVDIIRLVVVTGATVYLLMMALLFFTRKSQRNYPEETAPLVPMAEFLQVSVDEALEIKLLALCNQTNLTQRESQIFTYLCRGRSTPYICETLVLSKNIKVEVVGHALLVS